MSNDFFIIGKRIQLIKTLHLSTHNDIDINNMKFPEKFIYENGMDEQSVVDGILTMLNKKDSFCGLCWPAKSFFNQFVILIPKNTPESVSNTNESVLILYKNRLVEPKTFTIASF